MRLNRVPGQALAAAVPTQEGVVDSCPPADRRTAPCLSHRTRGFCLIGSRYRMVGASASSTVWGFKLAPAVVRDPKAQHSGGGAIEAQRSRR